MSATATLNPEPATSNAVSPSPPRPIPPSQNLPPSERDFQIYDAIHIDGSSTRDQAKQHGISQTRVRQIIRRVVEWLGEVLPPQTKVAKEQETHLARQIAADRFQRQFEQVNSLWTATLESKFASIRIRLTTAQARLGVVGGILDGLAADAIECLPVPTWTTTEAAVGWDKAEGTDAKRWSSDGPPTPQPDSSAPNPNSKIENPKSLLPPPHLVAKGLRTLRKEMPRELWDPFRWEEITPEIVAARAAWGWPFPPVLIQNLKKCGILPSDDSPAPDSAAPQSEICNPQSEIPSPPPPRECSPQSDDAPKPATTLSTSPVETHDANSSCDNNTAAQNDPPTAPNTPSQPLLTTPQTLSVTQLQLTPHQTGVTISSIAANYPPNPQNSQVASNSGGG